ncbi:MAG: peptidoglycan-binding protein [bacterium]
MKINSFKIGLALTGVAMVALPALTLAATLNRQLDVGSRGTDVSSLQTFLAQDVALYPQGLVTGYFGGMTSSAVSNFQTRNGLDAVGRVGPLTLPVINNQMINGLVGATTKDPIIYNVNVNVNSNNATVNWSTNKNARGVVYYSSVPLDLVEGTNTTVATVSGYTVMTDSNLRTTQNVSIQNLQPNTTYYYLVDSIDQNGNESISWPSTFHTSN